MGLWETRHQLGMLKYDKNRIKWSNIFCVNENIDINRIQLLVHSGTRLP